MTMLTLRKFASLLNRRRLLLRPLSYVDAPYDDEPLFNFALKENESLRQKRARLLWQSRKRGMLENCLLFANFADRYLDSFDLNQLNEYDTLINRPSNDWEIFYWVIGKKPCPEEYQNNSVYKLLVEYTKNKEKQNRSRQPEPSIFTDNN